MHSGKMRIARNTVETLWNQIVKGDCWNWTGTLNNRGYGAVSWGERNPKQVHRLIYELLIGPIPDGKELHHKCKNRRCCNPEHLELISREEHLKLEPFTNGYADKTHCIRGHLFDEENTYRYKGHRQCKACKFEYNKQRREKARMT